MRIAYVTKQDAHDLRAWSGLDTYILKALQSSDLEIQPVGNLNENDITTFLKGFVYGRFVKKIYIKDWEPSLLKHYAAQVKRKLATIDFDVIFSPRTTPIAYLKTEKPIVFWHDSTFSGMVNFYADASKISKTTFLNGNQLDQLALSKCRLAIYSSEWAANTAIQNYDVDPAKVKIVPFGANIECNRDIYDLQAIIKGKNFDCCHLLFIGVEWYRKGGDIAIRVAEQLNRHGIPTELHLVGCNPPDDLPGFVRPHGFISKVTPQGQQLLDDLFTQAHFFILPTRADCTPVVFPEAGSFGLPVLTTDVGGIPTVIQNGKNGFIFPLEAGPETYCDTIQRLWSSRQAYEQLALSSFNEYATRLNWSVAGRKVADLIHEYCG